MQATNRAQFNLVTSTLEPSGWLCLQAITKGGKAAVNAAAHGIHTAVAFSQILPQRIQPIDWMKKVHSPLLNSRHDTSHY